MEAMTDDSSREPLATLFVSHGAPTLPWDGGPACEFLRSLATTLPRPRAILCVSAHWETAQPRVTRSQAPATIHDFGGFPPELYEQRYPAPGDVGLCDEIVALLRDADFAAEADPQRGLDHGAWIPLMLAFPAADVPVVQLSLQPAAGPAHHLRLGWALAPLRRRGVLVLGSGGATHNLRAVVWDDVDAPALDYALEFDQWLVARVQEGHVASLVRYREEGPHGARNHPTAEHFLPLLVAMGAAGDPGTIDRLAREPAAEQRLPGALLHRSFTWGALSMSAFAWGTPPARSALLGDRRALQLPLP
jgi:4,5-DOPA dioxygenase extradiol